LLENKFLSYCKVCLCASKFACALSDRVQAHANFKAPFALKTEKRTTKKVCFALKYNIVLMIG